MFFQKKPTSATTRREVPEKTAGLIREAWWLVLVVAGSYLATILFTYHRDDPSWSHSASEDAAIHNAGGTLGAWMSDILLYLFGFSAWWLAIMAFYAMWWVYLRLELSRREAEPPMLLFNFIGFAMLLLASSALESGHLLHLNLTLPPLGTEI